jgi:hypothetical protein
MKRLRRCHASFRAAVVFTVAVAGLLPAGVLPASVRVASAAPLPHAVAVAGPAAGPVAGGFDISWPQCPAGFPVRPKFGIVGASDGLAYSDNPCLAAEYLWAKRPRRAAAFYINTADPGAQSSHWTAPGPKPCGGSSDDAGCAYNYGFNAAAHAFAYANAQTGAAGRLAWWLDIETSNTWSANTAANNADIQGMLDYFHQQVVTAGIYSTGFQWSVIAGGAAFAVPDWVAGAASKAQALSWCSPSHSFTGGPVAMVQYPNGAFDGDVAC